MTETKKLTLTDKLTSLDKQIDWFYSNDFQLEHATENYKSAIALAKDIEQDLANLKNEIEVLSQDFSK